MAARPWSLVLLRVARSRRRLDEAGSVVTASTCSRIAGHRQEWRRMELERHDAAARRTAHIVLRGDIPTDLQDLPASEIELVEGDTHIAARVANPLQLYDILDRLREIKATLLSL
jgi:hypothetical protein